MVATAVLCPNNSLSVIPEIKAYIEYCKNHNHFLHNNFSEYLSYKQAQRILRNTTQTNNTEINYLVVVPPAQNKGVGTRAVRSITHNMDFFAPENPIATIYTQIHKDNIPSQVIFRKENYKTFTAPEIQSSCVMGDLGDFVRSL